MEWVRGAAARGVLEAKRLLANEIIAVGSDDGRALVELPGGVRVVESAAELLRDLAKLKDSEGLCRCYLPCEWVGVRAGVARSSPGNDRGVDFALQQRPDAVRGRGPADMARGWLRRAMIRSVRAA